MKKWDTKEMIRLNYPLKDLQMSWMWKARYTIERSSGGKSYGFMSVSHRYGILRAQLEEAMGNEIPVVILDSGVESELVNTVCATDNYAAGAESSQKDGGSYWK